MSIIVVNIVIIGDIQRLVIKQKRIVTIHTVNLKEMMHPPVYFFTGD
jgi:hypothetical protein